jgi:hypothetical protein
LPKKQEAEVLRFVIKLALIGTLLTASTTPPVTTYAFAHGGGKPWFAGGRFDIGALLGLRPQPGWHVRRHASNERNFRRSHKAQRINASLKPHEAQRKTLFDQVPDPRPRGNDVSTAGAPPADRAPDQVQAAPAPASEPNPRPGENDVPIAGGPPPDRVPDAVQAAPAPASIIDREAGQTVGMAPVIRLADVARNTPSPAIESKGTPITRSLEALSMVMVMVVAALGLMKLLPEV